MKRLLAFVLALLYVTASTGFAIRQHWCMDEFAGASIHFGHEAEGHECSRCGMVKNAGYKNGCCEDKQKTVKAADESIAAKYLGFEAAHAAAVLPAAAPYIFAFPAYSDVRIQPVSLHQWPPPRGVPIYIRHCVFLI